MQRAHEDRTGKLRLLPSGERILACGALSAIMHKNRDGQSRCLNRCLHQICAAQTTDPDPLLRRWVCLCLGKLWRDYPDARFIALRDGIQDRVMILLGDEAPEVRASAIYALGALIGVHNKSTAPSGNQKGDAKGNGVPASQPQTLASTLGLSPQSPVLRSWIKANSRLHEDARVDVAIASQIRRLRLDGSVLVRHELLLSLARLFFHPNHSLPLQAVAYTIDRMGRNS